jgi:hypothetical protein
MVRRDHVDANDSKHLRFTRLQLTSLRQSYCKAPLLLYAVFSSFSDDHDLVDTLQSELSCSLCF